MFQGLLEFGLFLEHALLMKYDEFIAKTTVALPVICFGRWRFRERQKTCNPSPNVTIWSSEELHFSTFNLLNRSCWRETCWEKFPSHPFNYPCQNTSFWNCLQFIQNISVQIPDNFIIVSTEIPKTETNFEERLILKAFLLKFMNAYAPIFYVAFFKGR